MNAEILSVGTELLLGGTTNTDARDLSRGLARLGINVYWHTVVGDNPARLTECIYRARNRADLIITTGGLGPTCDDLTKQTLARAFELELEYHEDIGEGLRALFERRSIPFTENNLRQAWLPRGCTPFPNACGTAPGCAFTAGGVQVIMLPGPPRECNDMFEKQVVPYLRAQSDYTLVSHELHMIGIGESLMESRLRDLMDASNPTVAPYAREGECFARVTAKGTSEEECEELMAPVLQEIQSRLGEYIYGVDCDSLERRVNELLEESGKTLAAAESCTGGLVAKRMTDIPGSSAHFRGGVTVYTEFAKCELLGMKQSFIDENGVVSAAVAEKMAKKVRKRLGADFGIGITGWAGPDGDDVGLVYIALAAKGETWVRRMNVGRQSRERIRLHASNNALDMVRRCLTGLDV